MACIADVSGLSLDGDVFLAVVFFSLFFCSTGFQLVGNLNECNFDVVVIQWHGGSEAPEGGIPINGAPLASLFLSLRLGRVSFRRHNIQ